MTFRKIVIALIIVVSCQSISAQEDTPRPDINNAYITFHNLSKLGIGNWEFCHEPASRQTGTQIFFGVFDC